jgi:hypothetical protein
MPHALYDAVAGSLTLRQVTAANFTNNGAPIEGTYSNGLDVAEFFAGPSDARATFETEDIASVAAVANIGTAGLEISAGTISIPWAERANQSTFSGAGAHFSLTSANGFLIPTRFSVPSVGNASCGLELIFLSSDGDTQPVAITTGVTLAGQAFTGLYGLGPVAINGTTLDQVTGFTVTPGLSVEVKFYGRNYVTQTHIVMRRPVIEVTTEDLDTLSALGPMWGVGTSIVAYARHRVSTSWAADATASHIKFSGTDGIVKPADMGASGSGDGSRTIRFHLETLTIAGSSAIT